MTGNKTILFLIRVLKNANIIPLWWLKLRVFRKIVFNFNISASLSQAHIVAKKRQHFSFPIFKKLYYYLISSKGMNRAAQRLVRIGRFHFNQ